MRIRTIKPDFWRSLDIAALPIEDRLLFIGLWSYVDDNGVGRDEPRLIQSDLFPLDPFTEASVRVHGGLKRLSEQGLITRFEGPDGRRYLQIDSWGKHQKINRPSKPRFPQYDAETCALTEGSVNPHDALTEGSLPEQGTGNRDKGISNTPQPPQGAGSADAEPETLQESTINDVDDQQSTTGLEQTTLLEEPTRSPRPQPSPSEKKTPRKREAYPEEFEAFWRVYPRHADKKSAYRAWKQAVKEVPNEVLIAGAERYGRDPTRTPEFTKYAATWLRAGSWDNEPAKPAAPVEAPVVSMWDYAGRGTA